MQTKNKKFGDIAVLTNIWSKHKQKVDTEELAEFSFYSCLPLVWRVTLSPLLATHNVWNSLTLFQLFIVIVIFIFIFALKLQKKWPANLLKTKLITSQSDSYWDATTQCRPSHKLPRLCEDPSIGGFKYEWELQSIPWQNHPALSVKVKPLSLACELCTQHVETRYFLLGKE